jgi:hypothetical protein
MAELYVNVWASAALTLKEIIDFSRSRERCVLERHRYRGV